MDAKTLQDRLLANADYDVARDAAKARRFVVACRQLLAIRPTRMRHGGNEEMQFDPQAIQQQLNEALQWIHVNDPTYATADTVHFDLREMRE